MDRSYAIGIALLSVLFLYRAWQFASLNHWTGVWRNLAFFVFMLLVAVIFYFGNTTGELVALALLAVIVVANFIRFRSTIGRR